MESFKIRNRFIFLLYKFGLKKLKEDIDIINFLLSIELLPYNKSLINKNLTVISNLNIVEYTNTIKEFIDYNLLDNKYDSIDKKLNITNTTIGLWCSDNDHMKYDNVHKVIKDFLIASKQLLEIDTKLRENVNNGIYLFNLRKINQYIINIRTIINDILNSL